jgi:hypothetical protein
MTIQRYDVYYEDYYGDHEDKIDDGKWCLYSDVEPLIQELATCRRIIAEMKQAQNGPENEWDRP